MIKCIALLVIVLSLSLSAPTLAAEPGSGTIEGIVVNGTEGGSSVANLEITLTTYLDDAEVGATTIGTDGEGRFTFDGLSTEPGYGYQVTLFYQEAEYYSDWLVFDEEEAAKSVEVIVYDFTTSDETISVETSHTIIYVLEGNLVVKEYFLFVNDSDRTYIGPTPEGDSGTLWFSLPAESTELQLDLGLMECCIISDEDGFSESMPVLPGYKEVAYSYQIDYDSGTYTMSRAVNYPIADFNLLIQGEGVKVTNSKLTPSEPLDMGGQMYDHLTGNNLVPGDILTTRLSGLPHTDNQDTVKWAAVALVVLAIGSFFFMRKKRLQPVRLEENINQKRQRLLSELAELDDDFENDKIHEDVYRRLRSEKKAQLVNLTQGMKEGSGSR